jgi:hypothetical protein
MSDELLVRIGADVGDATKKIEDFSKKSRIALNSLSLVAQDLPYGFIGIQNNLPALISSFGALTSNTKEAGSVFKQLTTALSGPAGAYLAFSIVTSAITFLTQKYGSLNAAILAVSTSNAKLVAIQEQLNKGFASAIGGTAGETAKIQILVKTLNDLSKPMKERQDAYTALKKIAPEIAKDIDEENILSQKNIDLVNENTRARIEYIKVRARETAILNMVNKNEEERIALEQEYPKLLANKRRAEQENNKTKDLSFDKTKTFNAGLQTEALNLDFATSALNKNTKQRRELYKANEDLINQLAPLVKGTAEYDAATKAFTDSLKKQKKVKPEKELDIAELERKGRYAALKLQEQADKNRLKYLQEQLKLEQQITKETFAQADINMKADAEAFTKISFENLGKKLNPILEMLNNMAIGAKNVAILMEETFFNPLNEMFTTLFTKFTFSIKSFTNAILASIGQIAAKLATTLVIQGLVSLFSAPLALGGALSPEGGLSFIGKALSGLKLGKSADFSGVQGANMGMSGSVNLVLRGTDLVGSINRTNSQISRVG